MAAYALKMFDEVADKEALPSFEITVTRTHIIKYVGAGGDFQPIHHDEEFARSNGLPSIFANGLMHGGMLAKVVTDWAGYGVIRNYKLRFTGIVWPGDTLRFSGSVLRKRSEGRFGLVDCSLQATNQKGDAVVLGEATVSLPR